MSFSPEVTTRRDWLNMMTSDPRNSVSRRNRLGAASRYPAVLLPEIIPTQLRAGVELRVWPAGPGGGGWSGVGGPRSPEEGISEDPSRRSRGVGPPFPGDGILWGETSSQIFDTISLFQRSLQAAVFFPTVSKSMSIKPSRVDFWKAGREAKLCGSVAFTFAGISIEVSAQREAHFGASIASIISWHASS